MCVCNIPIQPCACVRLGKYNRKFLYNREICYFKFISSLQENHTTSTGEGTEQWGRSFPPSRLQIEFGDNNSTCNTRFSAAVWVFVDDWKNRESLEVIQEILGFFALDRWRRPPIRYKPSAVGVGVGMDSLMPNFQWSSVWRLIDRNFVLSVLTEFQS